jgi:hypothetical protein
MIREPLIQEGVKNIDKFRIKGKLLNSGFFSNIFLIWAFKIIKVKG